LPLYLSLEFYIIHAFICIAESFVMMPSTQCKLTRNKEEIQGSRQRSMERKNTVTGLMKGIVLKGIICSGTSCISTQ